MYVWCLVLGTRHYIFYGVGTIHGKCQLRLSALSDGPGDRYRLGHWPVTSSAGRGEDEYTYLEVDPSDHLGYARHLIVGLCDLLMRWLNVQSGHSKVGIGYSYPLVSWLLVLWHVVVMVPMLCRAMLGEEGNTEKVAMVTWCPEAPRPNYGYMYS